MKGQEDMKNSPMHLKNNAILKMKNQDYVFSLVEKEQMSHIAIWLVDNQQNWKLVWNPLCLVPSRAGHLQALPLPRPLTAGQPGKRNRRAPADLCARILIPAKSTLKKAKTMGQFKFQLIQGS